MGPGPGGQPEEAAPAGPEALPDLGALPAEEVIARLSAAPYVSVLAAGGLDELALCDGQAVFSSRWAENGEGHERVLARLFSPDVKKVGQDVKDLMRALLAEGRSIEGFVFDTALAGYVLDPTESGYDAARLAARHLGGETSEAQALWQLYPVLEGKLREATRWISTAPSSCRSAPCWRRWSTRASWWTAGALAAFGESLGGGIEKLQQDIWRQAGHEFNINSPKQLGEVLFEELMLPAGKKTKTGWSTNADVLEKLIGKHPIVSEILDYRMLAKLKSTYAEGLIKVISPDGRIHTNFKMTVTATGRISSTEPNLQNIPVRRELGGEIRKMFVSPEGSVLVDADYSQIELRILAHISGDATMQRAFLSGEDIHAVTASQVFGVPLEQVTPQMRSHAKAVNFGIVYGISAFSLAQDIGVRPREAQAYIDAYLEKYHGVREYMERVIAEARERGYTYIYLSPPAADAGAEERQPQHARLRRARGAQHANPGHGRGHHQAGDGQRPPAAEGRGPARAAHIAGA